MSFKDMSAAVVAWIMLHFLWLFLRWKVDQSVDKLDNNLENKTNYLN